MTEQQQIEQFLTGNGPAEFPAFVAEASMYFKLVIGRDVLEVETWAGECFEVVSQTLAQAERAKAAVMALNAKRVTAASR